MDETNEFLQGASDAIQAGRILDAWRYLNQTDYKKHPAIACSLGMMCYHGIVPHASLLDAKKYFNSGMLKDDASCMTMMAVIHTIEGNMAQAIMMWWIFFNRRLDEKNETYFKILMFSTYIKEIIEADALWHGAIARIFFPYSDEIREKVVDLFESDLKYQGQKDLFQNIEPYLHYSFSCEVTDYIMPYSEYE